MNSSSRHLVGFSWEDCPPNTKQLINDIVKQQQEVLGDNLIGFYLHGSLAMGCFNPSLSDIDFLVVVQRKLLVREKKTLIRYLLNLHYQVPTKGVEMSVVRERHIRHFVYPTPFELHYSEGWRDRHTRDEVNFTEQKSDEDLAAHLVVIRERGLCLFGKPVVEVFPATPTIGKAFIKSVLFDAGQIFEAYERDPLYATLNLCRTLAFLREGKILSKKEGADWALQNLPDAFSSLVNSAQSRYSSTDQEQKIGLPGIDDFIEYARHEIDLLAKQRLG